MGIELPMLHSTAIITHFNSPHCIYLKTPNVKSLNLRIALFFYPIPL